MGVNFQNATYFKFKYGRDPKYWSISEMHNLYERLLIRYKKRLSDRYNLIKEIISKIPNNKGEYAVYYQCGSDIHKSIFSYDNYKRLCVRNDVVKFSKDTVSCRNEKIDFILSNEIPFELGKKYKKLDELAYTFLHKKVLNIFWDILQDKLRKHFKDTNQTPNDIFIVNIGSKKYFVQLDEEHRYEWLKFHLKGEYIEGSINLN